MRICVQFTVTMDAKDLRTESALSERNNDGSKYSQSGGIALHCDRNKSYQDIGSNSLAKVDLQSARPCAVIGPDRIVPPPAPSEAYLKKGSAEPWPCIDNAYHTRRPPEYPHKLANFQNPTRNISPRQTFQENMQRIMVPPSYNSVKISDDSNYAQMSDRPNGLPKNIKLTVPPEAKFCEVPYTVYPSSNEQKNVRNSDMCLSSVNPTITRTAPHGWPPGSVNIRPTRAYGASELYQFQEYPSCAGPRPVVPRPNRTVPEEPGYVYAESFYHQEGNVRFKPYPPVKERFPQQRYEYIGNYTNSFHPPPFPTHKYELQKPVPPHPYPPYPPIKYLDRVPEPVMESYPRNQQGNYNMPYRNQIIHPNYGPVLGNCPQNKIHSYPPDAHIKTVGPNKVPYDNAKAYIEYENGRPKMYPPSDSYLVNEMGRMHSMKSQVIMPNYPTLNMHNIPPNPYYKKDNQQLKNYEYIQAHFRNMDPNLNMHNPMVRHQPVFSPNTLAISPTDSNASNDTSQTLGTSQEDCGYVSQSSTASVRSMDSGINRIPNDCFRKYYDSRFGPIIRGSSMMSKSELNPNNHSKEKKNINVRQFLQMWNEGDEETEENNSKEIVIQTGPKSDSNFGKTHEVITQPNQEQLYVLGLVNVPSEELGKYEHIQKVSKLPENIKGYNHIELLNQFEKVIESSNMNTYKTSTVKDFQMASRGIPSKQTTGIARPLSPLDVEAKISQSVIHKEVGCNFEIKPCSPKMLNVEVATPVQNILAERAIEKVANPVMLKSPRLNGIDENIDCNIIKRKDHRVNSNNEPIRIPSCKMVNTQFSNNNNIDSIKNSYSLQDLESNSGLCLASLPRLDNDIELNFPEVNQQFINANKNECIISNSLRDLPTLEVLEQSDSRNKEKHNDVNLITQENDDIKSPCVVDSESEFSKLSKYRKTKVPPSDSKENLNAVRTDSVIIKNPENTKNYEDTFIFSPNCSNKQNADMQQSPINLTSQGNETDNESSSINNNSASRNKDAAFEIAIDFSLNKHSTNDKIEFTQTTFVKDPEILSFNTIETSSSILDDQLPKLPSFSDCDETIQQTFINHDKPQENVCQNSINNCDSEATSHNTNNESNFKLVNNSALEQILTENNCLSPLPCIDSEMNENNKIPSVSCAKDTNDDRNDSVLPIEFVTPASELVHSTESDNGHYLMDIDESSNIAAADIDKEINMFKESTLNENDSKNQNQDIHSIIDQRDEDEMMEKNDVAKIKEMAKENLQKDLNMREVLEADLNVATSKGNNLDKVTDSSMIVDATDYHCLDSPKKEILVNSTYQSEISEFVTDSNCELAVSNNIEDYQESTTREIGSNNIESQNHDKCLSDLIELHSDLKDSDDCRPDISAVDSDPIMNSPLITNPKGSPCRIQLETTDQAIDSNLKTTYQAIDINSDTPSSNKNVEYSTNDCRSETIEEQTSCSFSLRSPNNNMGHLPHNYLLSDKTTSDHEMNCNVDSSNNCMTNNLSNEKSLDFVAPSQVDLNNSNENKSEDTLLYNFENTSETVQTIKSPSEVETYVNQRVRYLSYGSKEMYSPWIQKLIMFCEGKISNVKFFKDNVLSGCETAPMVIDYTDKIDRPDNCTTPVIKNKSMDLMDSAPIEENSKIEFEDLFDNNCINAEKQSNDENEIDKLQEVERQQESCEPKSISEDKCNEDCLESGIIESSTLIVNSTHSQCDELETFPNIEKSTGRLTPVPLSRVHEEWHEKTACNDEVLDKDKKSMYNDKLNEKEDEKSICNNDIPEQWDKQSHCSDEILEQWNMKSYCKDDTSDQWNKQSHYNDDELEQWDKQPDGADEIDEQWNNQSYSNDKVSEQWDNKFNCNDEPPKQWQKQSNCANEITKEEDKQSILNDDNTSEQWDKQSHCGDEISERWDSPLICNEDVPEQWDKQSFCNDDTSEQWRQPNCNNDFSEPWEQSNCNEVLKDWNKDSEDITPNHSEKLSNSIPDISKDISEKIDKEPYCSEIEAPTKIENGEMHCTKVAHTEKSIFKQKRQPLKRSLSDSALNIYNNDKQSQPENENVPFIWPFKRRKINNIDNDLLAQNLCNIIQSNRRNSISSFYNEENVSFCILIDNGCIIAEEEADVQEKICYTELSEECLDDSTKDVENTEEMTEMISSAQEENDCEYSDSYVMQAEDDKLEESWVEDVACVETVISDDIAEDIEISGPLSPKDDLLSDNDESGVFSSSEHTDKVKYIYGDKMCNDDAQFVETLYNTPQMDVNKTLVQRETLISGEYYDNDSLEKILSEPNDQELSPYVPDFTEPVYSPGLIDVKETVDEKENMDIDIIPSLQGKVNGLDLVMNMDNDKNAHENVKLGRLFDETQDDTIHSCESSVDNVFTYKENEENLNYISSSSPEVSSTTSEEKNSAILLKITNFKGSRISQINDISRDNKRPSCKFTEDKDYVQSHSNFPAHRPLLTKAAQKYIPPLKESMRDLKVKLSLPQHSLMKLKQLKKSKDEPKVSKQNVSVPIISKKPKPKFEDVLKSIDEIQFKMHKEKTKKSKKSIPKVVIKKNENGSHYASTSNKDEFNPDLTGRKWQPWVFIEKNHFIDKMAIRKKTKAVYSHRKRTFVLAEKFQKYKSVNSAKFVISPPISDCPSTGLKYTIRLKHNY